jgi:hypothetical protein
MAKPGQVGGHFKGGRFVRWVRLVGRILLGVLVFIGVAAAWLIGPYVARVRRFPADSAGGYHSPFYVYVSPGARRRVRGGAEATILVQPNNTGAPSDDPDLPRKDVWWTGLERRGLADDLGVVLLVPAFPRPADDWRVYTHALDRDVLITPHADLRRTDLQLLAMVDRARTDLSAEGLPTGERVLVQGFSASGMFANRFAVLHPARVRAVAAGAPGGWPIAPVPTYDGEELPYPAGIADLERLTGVPFDSLAYRAIPQLIVMGSEDDNDGLDFGDGWDRPAAAQVDRLFGDDPAARWAAAEAIYRSAGADARFLLVEGVGHDRNTCSPTPRRSSPPCSREGNRRKGLTGQRAGRDADHCRSARRRIAGRSSSRMPTMPTRAQRQ